ncbi:hypothetical protein POKO110462_03235 [Pontibacter korlensis]|uniref:Uncharacterized protein n=1 Tax=Pontibacter korlensis TaxID=400092 RepID=A0A0E3ZH44_9BACT|nr:hypothetical protein [Pontibacter korlensis]AKD03873.1 hypothetical protein PKOR_13060 [Pontibacter korlensis]
MKILRGISKATLIIVACFALVYLSFCLIRQVRITDEPTELHTNYFKILYRGILKEEAAAIASSLESNYASIRTTLEAPLHDTIAVFIHPTQEQFNDATGLLNSTANGTSRGPLAFHLKYETWYNSVFPQDMEKVAVHEFTHCIQLNILIQEALDKAENTNSPGFDKNFEEQFATNYPQWL